MDHYPFTDSFFESLGQYSAQIPAPTIPVETAKNHVPLAPINFEFQGILRDALVTAINEELGKLGGLLQCSLRDLVTTEIGQQFSTFTKMVDLVIREIKTLISEDLNKMKTGMEKFMQAAGDQFGLHPEEVD
ncbi:uncharacterized protein PgNI_11630 [Pyricularia grisea]|uniref:Uncharacterized protein n=1 Tax=Pyricularia grisea TaxID=148305 RepID=A0A6P8ANL8_PYRGI|nr:uncharacterized protein PgNI_11630 [Pyricularia grisea]KAI7909383.1 hypothetical protein M9X92_011659 [Pyricularia oryzae]TLD03628.1 hypothetical protein PgNI_11630 [Pyricularia grisea]